MCLFRCWRWRRLCLPGRCCCCGRRQIELDHGGFGRRLRGFAHHRYACFVGRLSRCRNRSRSWRSRPRCGGRRRARRYRGWARVRRRFCGLRRGCARWRRFGLTPRAICDGGIGIAADQAYDDEGENKKNADQCYGLELRHDFVLHALCFPAPKISKCGRPSTGRLTMNGASCPTVLSKRHRSLPSDVGPRTVVLPFNPRSACRNASTSGDGAGLSAAMPIELRR